MKYIVILLSLILSSCITVSTGGDHQIYKLDQRIEQRAHVQEDWGYWEAMKHLDLEPGDVKQHSTAKAQFAQALELMLNGSHTAATPILAELVEDSEDSTMISNAGLLLYGIYMQNYDWEALIALDQQLPGGLDDLNTIDLVKAWSSGSSERIQYPQTPQTLPIERSISGVPSVKVKVNGVEQTFWIDTGASFTVLSSDIAEKCGVKTIEGSEAKVGTSTDAVIDLGAGIVEKLEIGDLSMENHPTYIIPKENLELRLFKIFKLVKVDGILGWNAIQNLKLDIDYLNNTLEISKPEPTTYPERNLHYLTVPFVSMKDTSGVRMPFFIDTGANSTNLYPAAFALFDTSSASWTTSKVAGAGGFQNVSKFTLSDQSLLLGNTRIDFSEIDGMPMLGNPDEGFVSFYGVLGSDIAKGGRLILDYQNGWCGLEPIQLDE